MLKKKIYKLWKEESMEVTKEKKSEDFCQAFYERICNVVFWVWCVVMVGSQGWLVDPVLA